VIVPRRFGEPFHERLKGVDVARFPPLGLLKALELLKISPATVFHSQDPTLLTALARWARPDAAHVVTSRDPRDRRDWLVELRRATWDRRVRLPRNWFFEVGPLVRWGVRRADAVYTPAAFLRMKVRRVFHPRRAVELLPNLIDVPRKPVLKGLRPVLTFVGRLDPRKHPEAFLDLAEKFPGAEFQVVGRAESAWRDAQLRRRYAGLPNVRWIGYVDRFREPARMSAILSRTWVLVNTSYREGLPLTYLEAAAHECALVSALNPDNMAGRFGVHVRDENYFGAVRSLLARPRILRAKGRSAREYVLRVHGKDKAVDAHLAAYAGALERSRGRRAESSGRRPLRFSLTGGWFESTNVGDNAILAGLTDSIREKGPAEFTVFTSRPLMVAAAHGLKAASPRRNPMTVARALWTADALVFTGGTPFYDGFKHMAYFSLLAAAARLRGVPIILFGISLRSMKNRWCRSLARIIVRAASYAGAREDASRLALDKLIGRPGRARLLPDPGWQLRPAPPAWAENEAAALAGPGRRGPRVAICLRDLGSPSRFRESHFGRTYDPTEVTRLLSCVAELSVFLVKDHRAQVVFLPMHTESPDDDRVPARACARLISDASVRRRVRLAERPYGPREMKALLGAMDLVVGVRFHSLVLSASMGVPSYALGYASKNAALMDLLGRKPYSQSVRGLDLDRLKRGVGAILADLPGQRSTLARTVKKINAQYEAELETILWIARRRG
jgi:polysaccharide pyruvyl transferase WcaK-like protein/glycosyltransferase involved in cell wall biosynthesis